MIELPPPAPGSSVKVRRRGEALALVWPAWAGRRGTAWRLLDIGTYVFAILFLGVSLALLFPTLAVFITPTPLVSGWRSDAVLGMLAASALASGLLWAAICVFRSARRFRSTEALVIDADSLFHSPARRDLAFPYVATRDVADEPEVLSDGARSLLRSGACAALGRREILDVRLVVKGDDRVLSIKADGYDVDIGRQLSDADRAWLLDILRRWRDAGNEGAA